MANEENLIPFNQRTESEQREIAKKGGEASAEARRKKKSRQELLQTFLDGTYTDKKTGKSFTGQELIDKDIAAILGNPNHKHFMKMFEIMLGEKYDADVEKTKAETDFTKARTAHINGDNNDIEDLSELDNDIFNDENKND